MSRSVDLFLDSPLTLDELAPRLASVTELTFNRGEDGLEWITCDGQVVARLGPHHYLDDGDLVLSQYRYSLSCRVRGDGSLTDSSEVRFLRQVLHTLRSRTGLKLLLVLDLQYRDQSDETRPASRRGSSGPARVARAPAGASSQAAADDPAWSQAAADHPASDNPASDHPASDSPASDRAASGGTAVSGGDGSASGENALDTLRSGR